MGDVFGSRTRDRTPRTVAPCLVPKSALLQRYVGEGSYVDCYTTDIARPVSQAEFVEAFYTTPVFRLERLILRWAVSKPSTDDEARALATRHADSFAAWKVEGRTGNQLLLCDFLGRTRSWLMAEPLEVAGRARTRLYFGSAVVPRGTTRHGQVRLESSLPRVARVPQALLARSFVCRESAIDETTNLRIDEHARAHEGQRGRYVRKRNPRTDLFGSVRDGCVARCPSG